MLLEDSRKCNFSLLHTKIEKIEDKQMQIKAGKSVLYSECLKIDATHYYYYITQPLRSGRIWHKANFLAEFNWLEFGVFLLLD